MPCDCYGVLPCQTFNETSFPHSDINPRTLNGTPFSNGFVRGPHSGSQSRGLAPSARAARGCSDSVISAGTWISWSQSGPRKGAVAMGCSPHAYAELQNGRVVSPS